MKLPRWLVIAMLTSSALSVLGAAGWWWVTWPERTAREFVGLVAEGKSMSIQRMFGPELRHFVGEFDDQPDPEILLVQMKRIRRKPMDYLKGRAVFLFRDPPFTGIVVEWGTVVDYLEDNADGGFTSRLHGHAVVSETDVPNFQN